VAQPGDGLLRRSYGADAGILAHQVTQRLRQGGAGQRQLDHLAPLDGDGCLALRRGRRWRGLCAPGSLDAQEPTGCGRVFWEGCCAGEGRIGGYVWRAHVLLLVGMWVALGAGG